MRINTWEIFFLWYPGAFPSSGTDICANKCAHWTYFCLKSSFYLICFLCFSLQKNHPIYNMHFRPNFVCYIFHQATCHVIRLYKMCSLISCHVLYLSDYTLRYLGTLETVYISSALTCLAQCYIYSWCFTNATDCLKCRFVKEFYQFRAFEK